LIIDGWEAKSTNNIDEKAIFHTVFTVQAMFLPLGNVYLLVGF